MWRGCIIKDLSHITCGGGFFLIAWRATEHFPTGHSWLPDLGNSHMRGVARIAGLLSKHICSLFNGRMRCQGEHLGPERSRPQKQHWFCRMGCVSVRPKSSLLPNYSNNLHKADIKIIGGWLIASSGSSLLNIRRMIVSHLSWSTYALSDNLLNGKAIAKGVCQML